MSFDDYLKELFITYILFKACKFLCKTQQVLNKSLRFFCQKKNKDGNIVIKNAGPHLIK